jgi:Mg-chelatase subunit ChlD
MIRSALALATLLLTAPALAADPSPPPPAAAKPAAPSAVQSNSPSSGAGIETAVLVLDASGSMNEKVGEQTRLSIVQAAVRQLLQRWDKDIPLGLTAYGHHGTGCGDIEAVLPVAPVEPATFLAAVNGLRAAGGTPLTDAITAAAEQLDFTENQATIILISDGEESCSLDPCARARLLESRGIDLKIHVVGFGVSAELGQTKLACIANNTGGQFRTASDAASLNQALASLIADTKERKHHWRKRWGDRWGKNGRWSKGCWTKGKPELQQRRPDGRTDAQRGNSARRKEQGRQHEGSKQRARKHEGR